MYFVYDDVYHGWPGINDDVRMRKEAAQLEDQTHGRRESERHRYDDQNSDRRK